MNKSKPEERRSLSRVPLDEPCFVNLSVIGGGSYKVMISNVTARGLQADLPANIGSEEIPGNARVKISDFPEEMKDLDQISGTVMWVTHGCCGVQFSQELDDGHFLAFLDSL